MTCIFAVFEICHRSHSPLCSLFQIPKPTKIQVKIAQLILSPLLIGKQVENLCSPAAVSPDFHRFRRCHCGRNGSIASQSKRCVSKKFHGKTNQMRTSQKTCHMVVSHFLCLEEDIGSAKEMPRRCFQ